MNFNLCLNFSGDGELNFKNGKRARENKMTGSRLVSRTAMTMFQTELFSIIQMQSTAQHHDSTIRSSLRVSVEGMHQGPIPGPLRIWGNHLHCVSRPIEIHHKEADRGNVRACLQKEQMNADSEHLTKKEGIEKNSILPSTFFHFLMECK